MACKILFVDDEPSVLDAYKRILYREFEVDISVGGEDGLTSIRDRGPYCVVVSDMRMPGMNGAQFLAQVKQRTPDTVRMLLTGYTDLSAAMDAVNEGNIFRFLTKPCTKDVLLNAITAGVEQYRLITAEKELLEKTLIGSIKALTDVLSAASPEAFGRSTRIAHCVRHVVAKFQLPSPWRFEVAAMLSQLGCVTLDPELIKSSYIGEQLSSEETNRFATHPQVARDLLAHIPRLEPIAWMISQQLVDGCQYTGPDVPAASAEVIALGAQILKLAVALDNHRMKGLSVEEALVRLRSRRNEFAPKLIEALVDFRYESSSMLLRKLPIAKLASGMILQQDIKTKVGALFVPKGQELTQAMMIKLNNFSRAGMIEGEFMVLAPA